MQATKSPALSGNVIAAQHIHFVKPNDKKPVVASKPGEPLPAPAYHQPQVTLIKDGDTVRAIEVTCTCGEVIRLDCKYG